MQQAEFNYKEQLVAAIALRIRQSLNLESILQTTVAEVRRLMRSDRVLIYRLPADGRGIVVTESVSNPQWSILNRGIQDYCFRPQQSDRYQQGYVHLIKDLNRAALDRCYQEFLTELQVKANLVVPIIVKRASHSDEEPLWGLLIVHQCSSPRNWQQSEIELLQLLAIQVAIAIQQGELYQQVQTELQRRKQLEELHQVLITSAPVGIFQTDARGNYLFVNQKWQELTGLSLSAALGTGWIKALHLEDRDRIAAQWYDAVRAGREFNLEYRYLQPQGKVIWVAGIAIPLYDNEGEIKGYLGTVIDISDRQRRENILKDIASGVTARSGEHFFDSLVQYLTKVLEVDYAFVCKLIEGQTQRVRTLAFYDKNNQQTNLQNFEYDLAGTPCKQVVGKQLCIYPETIQKLFPDARFLKDIQAESYAGMPIFDKTGKALGLISIINRQPLHNSALITEVLKIFATRATAELERHQVEANLQQSNQVLQAISSIQTQFLADTEPTTVFNGMLDRLLDLTESEYGFIGEILFASDGTPTMEEGYMKVRGRPYLKTHAITNIAWNEETKAFYAENAPKGLEFHNLQTLFGAVMVTGKPVIANSPSTDPRSGSIPDGDPPLNAFLGIPFHENGILTGMVGIANREGGYNEALVDYLQPFLATCSRIIQAYRSDRAKQQAEAKIRQQAALLDLAHDTILVRNLDNTIIFWNRGAVEMYGWTAEEALGQKSHQLLAAKFPQSLKEIARELFGTGRWEGELIHHRRDGTAVTVMGRWSLLQDSEGNPEQILEINHDITKRKQAEEKIRNQAALLNVATDAIMVRGLDDRILFWNRGAEKLYGWTKAEILHQNANDFLYPSSSLNIEQVRQTVIHKGEWQGELHQVTKTGQAIVVQSRWTLVKNNTANSDSFLVVNTDVTEQKQLETQFLRTQRLESLGTLAGGIAHDLNNILAPILGFSRLLPLKLPNLDEKTKGFFQIMETNAQRGAALVQQILTFARGLEGDRGTIQIRHLITEIKQIIAETFPKTIELEINLPQNLWTVNGDVNQLHQVLMNLAVNARDAMPDGGKLLITAENCTLDAEYARLHLDATEGDYILITVSDTGVGIPPQIIDRIFEPFFTTKEIGRGTGLGLSTVIGIVKSHGGFVDVISDTKPETRGTQIKVFLSACETAATVIEDIEKIPQGNGELILVVDDENSILEVTKATLETYNYQVITARDGIEAIAVYAQNLNAINVIIMDIMMPAMNGKTAIRTLKKINPEIKIIAISGLFSSQEIIAEIDNNISAYIAKPYSNEELLNTINRVIHS